MAGFAAIIAFGALNLVFARLVVAPRLRAKPLPSGVDLVAVLGYSELLVIALAGLTLSRVVLLPIAPTPGRLAFFIFVEAWLEIARRLFAALPTVPRAILRALRVLEVVAIPLAALDLALAIASGR